MAKFTLSLFGETDEVEVSQQGDYVHVTRAGATAELRILHADSQGLVVEHLQAGGARRHLRLAVYSDGDRRQAWVNGRTFPYERVRRRGGGPAAGDGALAAAIPAVVSQILVAVGDQVTAGQKLILLESMKMVIPIQAPFDGRVTAVKCAAGESVKAGIALIELEEQAETP